MKEQSTTTRTLHPGLLRIGAVFVMTARALFPRIQLNFGPLPGKSPIRPRAVKVILGRPVRVLEVSISQDMLLTSFPFRIFVVDANCRSERPRLIEARGVVAASTLA